MSVNWETGDYKSPKDLSREVEDAGEGLARFLIYSELEEFPEELRDAVNDFQKTYVICEGLFHDAGVIS